MMDFLKRIVNCSSIKKITILVKTLLKSCPLREIEKKINKLKKLS